MGGRAGEMNQPEVTQTHIAFAMVCRVEVNVRARSAKASGSGYAFPGTFTPKVWGVVPNAPPDTLHRP
jgi:hypothetical protein